MAERGHPERFVSTTEAWPETVEKGPFKVGFLPISHSIPESSGLVIERQDLWKKKVCGGTFTGCAEADAIIAAVQ